jgi:hypothetical protein
MKVVRGVKILRSEDRAPDYCAQGETYVRARADGAWVLEIDEGGCTRLVAPVLFRSRHDAVAAAQRGIPCARRTSTSR